MLFRRFYDTSLAQATYLIGCQASGDAIVIDPTRDLAPVLAAAADEGVRISHVTETHIHADFVSGARDLARRTGARLWLSGEGGDEWQYRFAAADGATLLHDGDRITVGNIWLDVMHTPGHTPEHLTFLVTDSPAHSGAMGLVTGDFLFVGDVGRPDLLETAAGVTGSMEPAAHALFRSLERLRDLPDHLLVWPGHGAGSACGKALGAVPMSTLGYERRANWALRMTDEDAFVAAVLDGQPEPPAYFARMKAINRDGPSPLDTLPVAERRAPEALLALMDSKGLLIDLRPAAAFAEAHVPGAISLPYGASFSGWAGTVLSADQPFGLLAEGPEAASTVGRAMRDLVLIGFERTHGWFDGEALATWRAAGRPMMHVVQRAPRDVAASLAAHAATVLDVRGRAEWMTGHLPAARHVPLGEVPYVIATLPRDRPIIVHCQSGGRSAVAASILQRAGLPHVENLAGGIAAWRRDGLPVTGQTPHAGVPAIA
jgi:hydroxyacylglutathione hydrolase